MKEFWEQRWRGDEGGLNEPQRAKLEVIREGFPSGVQTVLDVGCGTGRMLEELRLLYRSRVSTDFAIEGLRRIPGHRVVGNCLSLPFRADSFDLVFCAEVIEHLDDPSLARLLAEARRVTRRYLLITTPYAENRNLNLVRCNRCFAVFHSSLHVRSFTERSLEQTFATAGFRLIWIKPSGRYRAKPTSLVNLNRALTGYCSFWSPNLRCPVCGNSEIRQRRARENALSLVLEGASMISSYLKPSKPHNLCGLFEKTGPAGSPIP